MGYSNPYSPLLLSYQSGLGASTSTANTYYNIGSPITVPRNGIASFSLYGYQSAAGSTATYLVSFSREGNSVTVELGSTQAQIDSPITNAFLLNVIKGDSLQVVVENSTASTTSYIDNMVVMLL